MTFFTALVNMYSMKEILERHHLHSKNLEKLDQPSLELQVHHNTSRFLHSTRKTSKKKKGSMLMDILLSVGNSAI